MKAAHYDLSGMLPSPRNITHARQRDRSRSLETLGTAQRRADYQRRPVSGAARTNQQRLLGFLEARCCFLQVDSAEGPLQKRPPPPGSSAWTTSGDVEVVLNVNSLLTFITPQLCVSLDGDELWEISIEGLVRSRLIKRSNMRQNSLHYFQL